MISNKIQKIQFLYLFSIFSVFAGPPSASISLNLTVGTDQSANACGMEKNITVDPGVPLNYCYMVTNTGTSTFESYNLSSDVFGDLVSITSFSLAPGETYQYNDLKLYSSSYTLNSQWQAIGTPAYEILSSNDLNGPSYDFADISLTGTALNLTDDGQISLILEFPFTMIGQASTEVVVSNNGGVRFATQSDSIYSENQDLLNISDINYIAPFWDDVFDNSGNVYHQTIGMSPDRVFIVQWENRSHFELDGTDNNETVTFQLKLYETSNEIQFHYKDVQFGDSSLDSGVSATVGIGGEIQTHQFSFNTASLSDSFALSFKPINNNTLISTAVASDSVQVIINTADINVSQDTITANTHSSTVLLPIENLGSYRLNWHVSEGPAALKSIGDYSNNTIENNNFLNSFLETKKLRENLSNTKIKPELSIHKGNSIMAYYVSLLNSFNSFDLTMPNVSTEISAEDLYSGIYAMDFFGNNFEVLYALKEDNSVQPPTSKLLMINTATGDTSIIGDSLKNSAEELWFGMTWDPSTNLLYAISINANSQSSGDSLLYSIDINTGESTYITTLNGIFAIDIAADIDGHLYTIDSVTKQLYKVDKATGALTLIGPIYDDTGIFGGLEFDFNSNILYWMSCDDLSLGVTITTKCGTLKTIDLAIGNSTSIGQVSATTAFSSTLAIASENLCDKEVSWLSMLDTSGFVQPSSTSNIELTFNANGLADGEYKANICIRSNDPDEPIKVIAVIYNVVDLIYSNGFENLPVK